MLLTLLTTFLSGILTCSIICFYIIFVWIGKQSSNTKPWKNQYRKYSIPKDFVDFKKEQIDDGSYIGINLMLQFLFQELKDTKAIRKWAIQKFRKEFLELINSNTGKLLDNIQIRSIDLGKRLPIIDNIRVLNNDCGLKPNKNESKNKEEENKNSNKLKRNKNSFLNSDDSIEDVVLLLDLQYDGDFQLSVDVDTVFGKSAYLSVKILKLVGSLRLKFTNVPFKHWSFAFVEEPSIDFEVESQFEGRSIPKLSSIITNQIRKSICRRHTLPNYKMRFKPFFTPSPRSLHTCSVYSAGKPLEEGTCEVILTGCTNLTTNCKDSLIYCTLTLDSVEWLEVKAHRQKYWAVFDCEFSNNQILGITFEDKFSAERYERVVVVTGVAEGSHAHKLKITQHDLLTSINGVKVTSSKYAAKMIKASKERFLLRLERYISGKLKTSLHKPQAKELDNIKKREEVIPSSGSKASNANKSGPKQAENLAKKDLLKHSHHKKLDDSMFSVKIPSCQNPIFNQKFEFDIKHNSNFMNVCLWIEKEKVERSNKNVALERRLLLGHVSVSMSDIALECALTLQGDVVKAINIMPSGTRVVPGNQLFPEYSNLPGFEEKLCHGNILLKFNYFRDIKAFKEDSTEDENKNELKSDDDDNAINSPITESPQPKVLTSSNVHEFHSVQLQSAVYCGFCIKKIWFKSASMCIVCRMICHKKCVEKCIMETKCTQKAVYNDKRIPIKNIPGSINNINLPGEFDYDHVNEEKHEMEAKLLGQRLYKNLPPDEREKHLSRVISMAQKEIESECLKNNELKTMEIRCSNAKTRELLREKVRNSDEKLKSLKLLMLQYCAGFQCIMDEEEMTKKEFERYSKESDKASQMTTKKDDSEDEFHSDVDDKDDDDFKNYNLVSKKASSGRKNYTSAFSDESFENNKNFDIFFDMDTTARRSESKKLLTRSFSHESVFLDMKPKETFSSSLQISID